MARLIGQGVLRALVPSTAVTGVWLALAIHGTAPGMRAQGAAQAPGLFRLPAGVQPSLLAQTQSCAPPSWHEPNQHVAVQYATRRLSELPTADEGPVERVSPRHPLLRRTPAIEHEQTTTAPVGETPQEPQRVHQLPSHSPAAATRRLPPVDQEEELDSLAREHQRGPQHVDEAPLRLDELPEVEPGVEDPDVPRRDPRSGSCESASPETSPLVPESLVLRAAPRAETEPARVRSLPSPRPQGAAPRGPATPGMFAVAQRAQHLVEHGMSLAERRAFYSARAEFLEALSIIAQALDMEQGERRHSEALASALRALREADDFIAYGSRLEADLEVAQQVVAHRTPVLKGESSDRLTPLYALQQYYSFAQQRLVAAGGSQAVASHALYALGKLHTLAAQGPVGGTPHEAKALVFHQAALEVDRTNWDAANELGVLLARCSQWQDAKRALVHSVELQPRAEAWHNLAVVHEALGEWDLARRARHEWRRSRPSSERRPAQTAGQQQPAIQWLEPLEFASISTRDTREP